jgi:hypothetical protein
MGESDDRIRFTLNGRQHELSRSVVDDHLSDISSDTIYKHARAHQRHLVSGEAGG